MAQGAGLLMWASPASRQQLPRRNDAGRPAKSKAGNTAPREGLQWQDGAMSREVSYYRVEWHHQDDEFPVVLYSALDEHGWEVRKVDVWANGLGVTSDSVDDQEFQSTSLGTVPTPSLEEINSDSQFSGIEITAAEFDEAWSKYVNR
jgi:hypothetical protein